MVTAEQVRRQVLRISNSSLDSAIDDCIKEAQHELIRAGVSEDVVYADNDPLVNAAIKAYCGATLYDMKDVRDEYRDVFLYRLDCLRKSKNYKA